MKKILLFVLITLTFLSHESSAQINLSINKVKSNFSTSNFPKEMSTIKRNCGTIESFEHQLNSDSSLARKMSLLEVETQKRIKAIEQSNADEKSSTIYKIPVVVHVVYSNSLQNISDAQIYSQISALNKDFRKLNADINQVPIVFSGIAADVGIEFCMASLDPQGNSTNGITRTSTNNASGFSNLTNDVKSNSTGGKTPWNPSSYLNIWVCDLQGTLLGYAQFPGGALSTDGVVIDYAYFGATGTATPPFNLGRTATHEIGHYFNLRHIWGDSNCGDDFVNDTPTQQSSNSQCPSFPHISCGNGPNGDMFMNFMDYVDDNCMQIFTNGQKARMLAALNSSGRIGLLSNNNYNCTIPASLKTCDTLPNYPGGNLLAIYRLSDVGQQGDGFIAGTNSYGDIGFSENFSPLQPLEKINSVMLAFGRAYGFTNSSFNVKVWKADGPQGNPGTVLASVPLTLGQIAPDIASGNYTVVTFSNPITVSTSYYVGIEFDNSQIDSIALYTTMNGQVASGKAYEKYDTGVWYPFTDPVNSWGINVALGVAPIVCIDYTGTSELKSDQISDILAYPNPAKESIEIKFGFYSASLVKYDLFDLMGKCVKSGKSNMASDKSISLDLEGLPSGLYTFKFNTDLGNYAKKISIVK